LLNFSKNTFDVVDRMAHHFACLPRLLRLTATRRAGHEMHELLIFFSTLGGLMFFGAMGFILGPILAALFVTAWEMFGAAFRTALAEPGSAAASPDYHPPA
jgi:predicted PurR-regulated permease PerM